MYNKDDDDEDLCASTSTSAGTIARYRGADVLGVYRGPRSELDEIALPHL